MLDEAIAKVKEIAVQRCCACSAERLAAALKVEIPDQSDCHTCHGDLAAVCDVALAAYHAGIGMGVGDEPFTEAEINRLLLEGSEGGKE